MKESQKSGDSHGMVMPPPTRLAGVDCEAHLDSFAWVKWKHQRLPFIGKYICKYLWFTDMNSISNEYLKLAVSEIKSFEWHCTSLIAFYVLWIACKDGNLHVHASLCRCVCGCDFFTCPRSQTPSEWSPPAERQVVQQSAWQQCTGPATDAQGAAVIKDNILTHSHRLVKS